MRCPGQDSRYWTPEAVFEVSCPTCHSPMEFFKDEATRRCKKCGHKLVNPRMDFGCAAYCKFAEQCIGELPPELLAQKNELLKDRVAVEVKRYFGRDFKRIAHATRVARYAEQIVREEKGDPAVVIIAAYLKDVGIPEAGLKLPSIDAQDPEMCAPPAAREILTKLGARPELIAEVGDLIGHHPHPGSAEPINFRAVFDADLLAHLEENQGEAKLPFEELAARMETNFLTESGRKLAHKTLLSPESTGKSRG